MNHQSASPHKENPLTVIDECIDLFFIIENKTDEELSILLDDFHKNKLKAKKQIAYILAKSPSVKKLRQLSKRELYVWLSEYYARLKNEIKDKQKKGIDLNIEKLLLHKVPLKLKLFFVTGKKREAFKVYLILDKVHTDIVQKVQKKFRQLD